MSITEFWILDGVRDRTRARGTKEYARADAGAERRVVGGDGAVCVRAVGELRDAGVLRRFRSGVAEESMASGRAAVFRVRKIGWHHRLRAVLCALFRDRARGRK